MDALPALVRTFADRAVELVVERRPGEVGVEERLGEVARQPDPVERERLVAGEPDPVDVDQLGVEGQAELRAAASGSWTRASVRTSLCWGIPASSTTWKRL
jgi:hypothetical protein